MKFTCDSCGAQYMISDEKVGPNGVKVRCKKCSNVIVVKRATEAASAAAAAPAAAPAAAAAAAPAATAGATTGAAPGAGLDAELGHAFDAAFGDTPPSTAAPGAGGDLAETQLMGSEDAAKVFAAATQGAPAATEWYVAIGQAQVGPLPLPEVKRKWEAGDVGPDSLVWRPGMADWSPLSSVPDLAGYLSPVPRSPAPGARPSAPAEPAASPEPQPAKPAADVTWKPVGASALAALASEEIAARNAPEPRPAAARPAGKALVDALPDGGGVDPTGALPLSIKALETTGEKKLERRTSVARGAEKVRHRRSTMRSVAVGVVIGVVLVAGAAFGGVALWRRISPPPPVAAAAPAAPLAAPAPAPQPPVQAVAATPEPTPAVATAPVAPGAAAALAAAPPAAPAPEPPKTAPAQAARVEPPPRKEPVHQAPATHRAPTKVAAAPAAPPAPTPAPAAPAPTRRKGDSLLDFESNDAALDDALGGGGDKPARSVYVPPARAGGGALPDKVSAGDINAAVAQRIDSLRRCVSEQKAREPDATGTLKMRWIIQGDGSARDVKCLTSEYAQGAFAQCIAGVVKTIKFPRSTTTGQEVTFPFNF